jgi:type II secretory pathway component PulF
MNYECTVGFADGTVSTIRADVGDVETLRETLASRGVFLLEAKPVPSASRRPRRRLAAPRGSADRVARLFATLLKSGVMVEEG